LEAHGDTVATIHGGFLAALLALKLLQGVQREAVRCAMAEYLVDVDVGAGVKWLLDIAASVAIMHEDLETGEATPEARAWALALADVDRSWLVSPAVTGVVSDALRVVSAGLAPGSSDDGGSGLGPNPLLSLPHVGVVFVHKMLETLPTRFSDWWISLPRGALTRVEEFVAKHVTPGLLRAQIDQITEYMASGKWDAR
jgi:hypothetical protein